MVGVSLTFPLVGVCVIVAAVGIAHLGAHGLWYDEGYTMAFATAPQSAFNHAIHRVDGPIVFYYALIRAWFLIAPHTVESARFISLLFAVGSLPLIYRLGSELRSSRAGLIAAVLLACNSAFWIHAEDARTYAIAMFFSLAAYLEYTLIVYSGKPTRRYLLAAVLVALGAFQLVVGLLTLAALIFTANVSREGHKANLDFVLAAVGMVCLGLTFRHLGITDSGWLASIPLNPHYFFGNLLLASGMRFAFPVALLVGIHALGTRRRDLRIDALAWWVILPVAMLAMTTFVHSLWIDRYLIGTLGPLIVWIAWGIDMADQRIAGTLLAAMIGLELYETHRSDAKPHEDWSGAVAAVAHVKPGTLIVMEPRGEGVALTQEFAEEDRVLPLVPEGSFIFPGAPWSQWANPEFANPPLPTWRGDELIVFYGFEPWYKPSDYASLYAGHHECGRSISGARPLIIHLCRKG
jgi:mannosyltransferase